VTRVRRSFAASVGGLPRTFWWLWTGTLISRTGGFVLPFLAFYVVDGLGYSAGFAGLVVASAGLGSIGAALGGGVLADRIGRRPVLLGSQLLSAVTLVGLGLSESRPALLGWAAAYGLTHNASRPAYSAMMTDIVAPADRIRAFSLHFWAINLGFAIAPTLAGLLAGFGYLTLFVADAAATTVVAVLVYLRVPESLPSPAPRVEGVRQDRGSLLDVLRDRVFMSYVLLTLGFALIFMQHLSTVPVQMRADGLTPAQYGAIIAVNGILIVLVTVPLTRALQRFPRARVMAVSSLRGDGTRRRAEGLRPHGRHLDPRRGHRRRRRPLDRRGPLPRLDAGALPGRFQPVVLCRGVRGAPRWRRRLRPSRRHGAVGLLWRARRRARRRSSRHRAGARLPVGRARHPLPSDRH
jgi:MFS family permease